MIDAAGHRATDLLRACLLYFPVEEKDPNPVLIMDRSDEDKANNLPVRNMAVVSNSMINVNSHLQTPIWDEFREIINNTTETTLDLLPVERFAFYKESEKVYALVQTGETSPYGNIIITKGVVFNPVVLNG